MNINCIICSDLISQTENIFFTKCGHVFHYHCLSQWIERSKSCPQCRNKVTEKCIFRVYFNFASSEGITEDATAIQSKLDNANFVLRQKESEIRDTHEELKTLKNTLKVKEELLKGTEEKLITKETAILALKDQLIYCKVQSKETEKLRTEKNRLEKSLNTLNGLQKVLNATADEVERMVEAYTDVKQLATFASALKRALQDAETKKTESRQKLQEAKTDLATERHNASKLQATVRQLQEKLSNAERKLEHLNKRKFAEVETSLESGDCAPAKIRKSDVVDDSQVLITPSANTPDLDVSIRSMVKRIEDSESPYLQLQQGTAIGTLRVRNALQPNSLKPSEVALLKPSKSHIPLGGSQSTINPSSSDSLSIFNKKPRNKSLDMFLDDMTSAQQRLETSYDGLGGHSKPDVFPIPIKRSPVKSCVPKVTSKHRLKNPNAPKTQGIDKFFRGAR